MKHTLWEMWMKSLASWSNAHMSVWRRQYPWVYLHWISALTSLSCHLVLSMITEFLNRHCILFDAYIKASFSIHRSNWKFGPKHII